MSNWLFDNMVEGFGCMINGPAGRFTCIDHPAGKLLFLAAGSGITPVMSMLRWLADTSSKAVTVFINNVRTPDDIIFNQELLYLSVRLGANLKLAIVPGEMSPWRPGHAPSGKLDETLLKEVGAGFHRPRSLLFVARPGI
jgi:glycine betaine catabolism B